MKALFIRKIDPPVPVLWSPVILDTFQLDKIDLFRPEANISEFDWTVSPQYAKHQERVL
jgi:hypothetical protein